MEAANVTSEQNGLRVVAYPGDNKILLAMSLPDDQLQNLAGFAIWRKPAGKAEQILSNRIAFSYGGANANRKWFPSDAAPLQKFRWIDVPPDGFTASIAYRIKALYFAGSGTGLKDGPQVSVNVHPAKQTHTRFQPAFTRGYISSQAYIEKFKNAAIRPDGAKTPDFDTRPYQAQYEWLGADARQALFDFIADCEHDKQSHINVFAYDLDEPDVVAAICRIAREGRLRAILDDAPLHQAKGGKSPPEVKAAQMIKRAAGEQNVRQGHFDRFQHNKVFIKRDAAGQAQRVFFGSMNFSVRGLYVQQNNVIVVDDPGIAGMFAKAFDVAFTDDVKASPFRQNPVSQGYMVGAAAGSAEMPKVSVALSPHTNWSVSLGPMADRIRHAGSSVLFAVMEPTGSGPVLASLRAIAANPVVFSYGTVETDKGIHVQKPDGAMSEVTEFAALAKHAPPPFDKEITGGPGMHIHNKYVVVDFNGDNPTVFTGSSNLAAGGEQANGDNLVIIEDAAIANMYAVEALASFDHYHFRAVAQAAGDAKPITLWAPGSSAPEWWKPYYDPSRVQLRDRCLFAQVPLPAGLATVKHVDWTAIDAVAAAAGKPPAGKVAAATSARGKAPAAPPRKRAAVRSSSTQTVSRQRRRTAATRSPKAKKKR